MIDWTMILVPEAFAPRIFELVLGGLGGLFPDTALENDNAPLVSELGSGCRTSPAVSERSRSPSWTDEELPIDFGWYRIWRSSELKIW